MKLSFQLLFSFTLFFEGNVWAAACCGGGFAAPSIISGDDKAQLSSSISYSEIAIDNVDAKGIWRTWEHHQKVQTFRIEGAHIFKDRWQAGFAIPVVQRSRLDQSYSGFGDVTASVGYEYLPDWDYNPFRPKGIGYLQLTLPTGKSKAESEIGGLDSRGNGFWALGLGTLLTKAIGRWDAVTAFEFHRSFDKAVSNSQIEGTLKPGYGGNFTVGGGYNAKSWRYGSSITWSYEDAIHIQGVANSQGSIERYATAVASASYLANDHWSGSLNYSDQTLFGNPVNTSLGKTLSLQIQHRWER